MTAAKQGEKLLKILSKFSSGLNDFVEGKGGVSSIDLLLVCHTR
jgi:hypothetical protein